MTIYKLYKEKIIVVNKILFLILIFLHIMDLSLTWIGVGYLNAFEEGNCYYKESIEQNNYLPIISHKIISLSLFFSLIYISSREKYKNKNLKYVTFFSLSFIILIYLYTVIGWIFNIVYFLFFYK